MKENGIYWVPTIGVMVVQFADKKAIGSRWVSVIYCRESSQPISEGAALGVKIASESDASAADSRARQLMN
jgi:hypothetical protein